MIQRLARCWNDDGETFDLVADPDGQFVTFDDHQAELAELQDSLDFVLQARDFILHEFNRLVVKYGEQKHEIRRLQAELAKRDEEIARFKDCYEQEVRKTQFQYLPQIEQLQADLTKKEEELDELRKDRDLAFGQRDEYFKLLAKRDEEIVRLKKDRDEWQAAAMLNNGTYERQQQTIAQLQADLDQVLGEAVWAMEELRDRLCVVDEYNREIKPERERELQIETFLTSPLVQAWRERQK